VAGGVVPAAATVTWVIWASLGDVSGPRLAVVEQPDGVVLYERPIEVSETFVLEHTHSVTRRLVVETFSIADENTVAIEEMWFDEFGPNLPAGPEHVGDHATFLRDGDGYKVVHHGHPIGTVPLRVGSTGVGHVLTFQNGERLRLLDVARPGAWVELIVQP
jgi:hypothetical protein